MVFIVFFYHKLFTFHILVQRVYSIMMHSIPMKKNRINENVFLCIHREEKNTNNGIQTSCNAIQSFVLFRINQHWNILRHTHRTTCRVIESRIQDTQMFTKATSYQ